MGDQIEPYVFVGFDKWQIGNKRMKGRFRGAGRNVDRCYFPVMNFLCQFFLK